MATDTNNSANFAHESFGSFEDIETTLRFIRDLITMLNFVFEQKIFQEKAKENPLLGYEEFMEVYDGSITRLEKALGYYENLLKDPKNPLHAKQLIDLLFALYQIGFTGEIGAIKMRSVKDWWKRISDMGHIPLKALLLLLKLINDSLGSLSKALPYGDLLDEAKKLGENIIEADNLKKDFGDFQNEWPSTGSSFDL